MLNEGMKIKIFEDTDVRAYKDMVKDMGFRCKQKGEYLIVGAPYKRQHKLAIGKSIKEARLNSGLSVEEVAKKVNVLYETVCNWEIGESTPNETNREKLKTVIGWKGIENVN